MKRNREKIIRISPFGDSRASLLELPGPEYSSHDDEGLAHVRSLIQGLVEKTDHEYLIIDLSNVQFFGARFIGTLVNAWDQLKRRQRHLAVCGLTPFCARLMQVLHLDKLFEIFPTRAAVLERISPSVLPAAQEVRSGQNRLEISEVDWDKNLVRLEIIGGDNVPVRSVIEPRREMNLNEDFRLANP